MNIFELMFPPIKFKGKIRLFEAFSGIGTQAMALKRLGVDLEIVGISEIDKYAIQSYEAIHGKVKNYGGIGSFDKLPAGVDVATWSFPCQDISLAGKQKGMEDGTRSNYGYVFLDTVKNTPKEERPKVLLMENVNALFTEKFRDDWREIQLRLERLGYTNYADVLNAKDYGVAQNRERVFIVSILGEYNYNFPKPIPLVKKLKDYLEDEVDEKYYLSDDLLKHIEKSGSKTTNFIQYDRYKGEFESLCRVWFGLSPTIHTKSNEIKVVENEDALKQPEFRSHLKIKEATKQGYALVEEGDGVYINRPHQKRGVVQKDKIQTIKTSVNDIGVVVKGTITTKSDTSKVLLNNLRIRKLTPLEAWRLMGIKDEDFHKAKTSGMSDTQLYKQAGNAIVVDVLVAIFKEMIDYE